MTEPVAATLAREQRVVRVFVSSTFRDMQADRDELVKHVFPQLRKLCESREVTWGEVDLRWGITDEQTAEGQVLPICLAEIKGCRPHFLGLLGDRYGWVPDEIDPALVEQEPWLEEHRQKSVTELEILHGVLNNPAMADHAFFYLRDPAYAAGKPDHQEDPTEEEIASHGADEAERRAHLRREKLAALKKRIRGSGLPVRDGYPDPRALGELVLEDLTTVIDRLYPEGLEPQPLEREAAEHEAFARSRAGVYIGRPQYFEALDAHARGDGPPLVVLGESGSGKSALLANWALSRRGRDPDVAVLTHFVGASPASADLAALLRRIVSELAHRFELEIDVPDRQHALAEAFGRALRETSAKGRAVLILDGLDQLEDSDGAPVLEWLPEDVPAGIRLIASTLPGAVLNVLDERGWSRLQVEPLEDEERRQLIAEYLAQHTKTLSPARIQRIAGAELSRSPLYLRALLDELRVHGVYETLDERIDHYLAAATVDGLFQRILERYERDYERERAGLVRDSMSLIWAARHGLSEAELLDLLGSDGNSLPRALWSPLYLAVEPSFVNRAGVIGFFHDYLRRAVHDRYLPSEAEQRAAHLRLADYFETRDVSARKIAELPWQLRMATAWARLHVLLMDAQFRRVAAVTDRTWLSTYVLELRELLLPAGVRERPAITAQQQATLCLEIATLRGHHGRHEDVPRLREQYQGELSRLLMSTLPARLPSREFAREVVLPVEQAVTLETRGDLETAMELLRDAERSSRDLGESVGRAISLGNQARIFRLRGNLDRAMALEKEAERIYREQRSDTGIATSLLNQGIILNARGELDGAMELMRKAEAMFRKLGENERSALGEHRSGLAASLGNQATVLHARGDLRGALALEEEAEQLYRELGSAQGLATSLFNQARLHVQLMEPPAVAVPLLEEALDVADDDGLVPLVSQIEPFLASVRTGASQSIVVFPATFGESPDEEVTRDVPVEIPTPHPRADPARASALNKQYLAELAAWEALPWWKRRTVKKPERPTGI